MKKYLKNLAQRFGYDILHLPTNPVDRQWLDLIKAYQIDLIFDVGANSGQFGKRIRGLGYTGKIVSFEPMTDAFQQLKATAATDPNWLVVNSGIGDYNGTAEINIAANSYSSSILNMLPAHTESAPDTTYVRQQSVRMQKIDSILDQYYSPGQNLYIKVDTQGFERQVFEGSIGSLPHIKGFQMELSLQPMYEGETLLQEMILRMQLEGFKLKLMDSGHRNHKTGELLQVEVIFFQ